MDRRADLAGARLDRELVLVGPAARAQDPHAGAEGDGLPHLHHVGVLGNTLGGWEVSGITRFQSGQYFTVTGDTSIGNRRADYNGGDIQLPDSEQTVQRWFNTQAFSIAPADRRGNGVHPPQRAAGIVPELVRSRDRRVDSLG